MLHRTLEGFTSRAAAGLRLALAGGAIVAGFEAIASPATAQIVRPAIGRFHDGRTDPENAFNIERRYLDRQSTPRFRERRTHLGWEVRGESFVVFANSSRDDALAAAEAVENTWNETLHLADYFTERHQQPNFSVAAIAVHVDANPRREREQGLLRFTNDKTHIYLNVADGEANLEQQLGKLRASTVHAFWWRSEFQRQVPEWVRTGMASYIATQQSLAAGETTDNTPVDANVYDPYWERERIAPDELAPREVSPQEAAIRVQYLLEGDDARHAPAFFRSLAAATREAPPEQRLGGMRYLRPNNQTQFASALDQFYDRVEAGMSDWLSNPMVDQPVIEPMEGESQISRLQAEMAFVLKLAWRMDSPRQVGVQPKVIGGGDNKASDSPPAPISITRLQSQLTGPGTPLWATLDPDGNLLLSDHGERVRELLRPGTGGSYRGLIHNGQRAIETRLNRNTRLIAWMEENPDSPRQPIVKFQRVVEELGTSVPSP